MFIFAHHNAGHTFSMESGFIVLALIAIMGVIVWRLNK